MKQEATTEILTVDDMLKGRLQGMIANVQHKHRQQGSTSQGAEEGAVGPDEGAQVTKDYVMKVKAQGAKGEGRHVSQDYAQAVNNRTQVVATIRPSEEQLPARATKKDRVIEKPRILSDIENAKKDNSNPGQAVNTQADGSKSELILEQVVDEIDERVPYTGESHDEEEILEEEEEEEDGVVEEVVEEESNDHEEEEILEDEEGEVVEEEEVIEDEEESVVEEEVIEEEADTEEHTVEENNGEYEDEVVDDDGGDYEDEIVE